MSVNELGNIQRDLGKLKSLYMELAEHESFNPYKGNIITGMPKGSGGKNFSEWYIEEKERIEEEIEYYKEKVQHERANIEGFIKAAPYPECEIIQYRAVNGLGWFEIGELMSMDRRTASRKFYKYIESCPQGDMTI